MRVFRSVATALLQRTISVKWTKYTFGGIAQYLETFHIPPTGPHWVDTFLLPTPTLLIHQFERAELEGELLSPTETADDEANDEVFHPCCTCQVCILHYLVFDGNGRAHDGNGRAHAEE